MTKMLINATQSEELRLALVKEGTLENLHIEVPGKEQKKANIYTGVISRIEQSLEAIFVDYGQERHGFLPFREVADEYFSIAVSEDNSDTEENEANSINRKTQLKQLIKKNLKVGQKLLVQVDTEERGSKGAALTTFISLAGCYLVLMPNTTKSSGISRRIDSEHRTKIKENLSNLNIPEGMSVIVRTAGYQRDLAELQWDLQILTGQWHAIIEAKQQKSLPCLIFQEGRLIIRAIRDYLRPDIEEILIDSPQLFEETYQTIQMMRPDFLEKVKLYNDTIPLFNRFAIESQIQTAFQRVVLLPSGGSIVLDQAEALLAIDINSAKANKASDVEETALQTNLEAADEIARQLRLRDIGGLIAIDFIDMSANRNQRAVEERLNKAISLDRARIQVGHISRFGILEMSRQRLRPTLTSATEITCPHCQGQGTLSNIETLSLNMLRLIEEEAIKENVEKLLAELPVEITTYIINEKRQAIIDIERRHHINIIIVPNKHFEMNAHNIKSIQANPQEKLKAKDKAAPSYTLAQQNKELDLDRYLNKQEIAIDKPAVDGRRQLYNSPCPSKHNKHSSIIKRLWNSIVGEKLGCETQEKIKDNVEEPHKENIGAPRKKYPQKNYRKKTARKNSDATTLAAAELSDKNTTQTKRTPRRRPTKRKATNRVNAEASNAIIPNSENT